MRRHLSPWELLHLPQCIFRRTSVPLRSWSCLPSCPLWNGASPLHKNLHPHPHLQSRSSSQLSQVWALQTVTVCLYFRLVFLTFFWWSVVVGYYRIVEFWSQIAWVFPKKLEFFPKNICVFKVQHIFGVSKGLFWQNFDISVSMLCFFGNFEHKNHRNMISKIYHFVEFWAEISLSFFEPWVFFSLSFFKNVKKTSLI